jgi:hypothetical protein
MATGDDHEEQPEVAGTMNRQRFSAVTSRRASGQRGKLMQLIDEARVEKSETVADSYPIVLRSHELVVDLDDRLKRIFAVFSLLPLQELKRAGTLTRKLSRGTRNGHTGFESRLWDSSGTHVVSLRNKNPRFTRVLEADDGTRTHHLLHGKDGARGDRG